MPGMASVIADRMFLRGHVDALEQAASHTRLIRLTSSAMAQTPSRPGQQVRVLVSGPVDGLSTLLRGTLRTYSIWSHQDESLELCVYDHGEGPGNEWARTLQPGDEVTFRPPEGNFVLEPVASYHLTATVPIGAMLRALPADSSARADVVLEAEDASARLALPDDAQPRVHWVDRGSAPTPDPGRLVQALSKVDLPETPGTAYVAGEARTCQAVRAHLMREHGWPRRSIRVKPFWAPGKRGME
jgi:NADPH-dependent ferric siderophore reductase